MFSKVLIANRGEIACRVIRALRRMGIGSVAVYSEADSAAPHVLQADEAVLLGPPAASESYLRADKLLAACRETGAQAVHPGYGFLSENADFAQACADAGVAFIGPTAEQIRAFGLKHTARGIAQQAGVAMLPGTELLHSADQARAAAERIGYPVILKSTAGGGGIGMQVCTDPAMLLAAFDTVARMGAAAFKQAGVYLEKFVTNARHLEVQMFGDGRGHIVALGERDCSAQRRNQKVIEETPAPNLSDDQRRALHAAATKLCAQVGYHSAGTVEFVFDADTRQAYFLEVNTRLQVEHTVTEEVLGVDLVEWMIKQAAGELDLSGFQPRPSGHAIQVRLYAEDPAKSFQPSSGILSAARFPDGCRVDGWVADGTVVSPFYDPLLAKVIVRAESRPQALAQMQAALAGSTLAGIETNLEYVRQVLATPEFSTGQMTTRFLTRFDYRPRTVDVLDGGTFTTVQDWPGRLGYWDIGLPPNGPMDSLAFRLGNRVLGNTIGAAGLECTLAGPTLRFNIDTHVCIAGADMQPTVDGQPVPMWTRLPVARGTTLKLGSVRGGGFRTYVLFAGGLDVPEYLGSRSTFTLGQLGGHAGRTLVASDVLHLNLSHDMQQTSAWQELPVPLRPRYTQSWDIAVMDGPLGAPDYFTPADIDEFYAAQWKVHHNSARTGVRLIGPKPKWARPDGGEAGLHPSNIHDNPYTIGTIDYTGDMPVILGPDGPSLGGFVCPATIVVAELWKFGQLRPGDSVRFRRVTYASARHQLLMQEDVLAATGASGDADLWHVPERSAAAGATAPGSRRTSALADPLPPTEDHTIDLATLAPGIRRTPAPGSSAAPSDPPQACYRQCGDDHLLVEYGPMVLDLELRCRVHALHTWLLEHPLEGVRELTPGVRSLQVRFDPRVLDRDNLLATLADAERKLPTIADMVVPARVVHLPLSWDDPATRVAIDKYMHTVRSDAPWCPSNIEFIRRINGLATIDDVQRIVFDARYLVLGLGDVYLGAPVATPLDPRHRLVTTKYNPARTWTPENAVGIGGAYMCIYGMEGPGGYQFVGRTVQMWNTYRQTADFIEGKPWLLRFFDQVRFYPVTADELLRLRRQFLHGQFKLNIEPTSFSLREYRAFLNSIARESAAFKQTQQAAFDAERESWKALPPVAEEAAAAPPDREVGELTGTIVRAPIGAGVWKVNVVAGQHVAAGESVAVLEAMKVETHVLAPTAGAVSQVLCRAGQVVAAGQPLMTLVDPLFGLGQQSATGK